MTDTRLQSWFDGEISDDDLTEAEVLDLQERVFSAVTQKILERPGVHSFAEHKTLQ